MEEALSDTTFRDRDRAPEIPNIESAFSAVAWGPIVAGAVAAVATSIVLFTLGSGLGLSAVSPWPGQSASAASIGIAAGIWIIVVQWLSSAMGGYLTGRMRAKWAAMQTDEVFFRDTAHGFLAWGLATIITATIIASAGFSALSIGATAVQGAAEVAASSSADDYALDTLFRGAPGAAPAAETADRVAVRDEAGRIFVRGMDGELAPEDRTYLAQLVAEQSGISQEEAEARVDATIASARETAEEAREAAASSAILLALALVIGAFIGAAAGGLGGRHRDEL
jgi:hypothetical protein